jgi:DNA mismatch repair protein MutS
VVGIPPAIIPHIQLSSRQFPRFGLEKSSRYNVVIHRPREKGIFREDPFAIAMMDKLSDNFRLLWPEGAATVSDQSLNPQAVKDLELDKIIAVSCDQEEQRESMRRTLLTLCKDAAVIRYRQEIIEDLLRNPGLIEAFKQLLSHISGLRFFTYHPDSAKTSLHEVIHRAGELEILVECITTLQLAFDTVSGDLTSSGLSALKELVEQYSQDPSFQELTRELPDLMGELRSCASITVGINLDEHLRPEEATLISVNKERFTASSLLKRLVGKNDSQWHGIAPLHGLPYIQEGPDLIGVPMSGRPAKRAEPMMVPLFRDLSETLEKITQPIARALKKYVNLNSNFLFNLYPDLAFYSGVVNLIQTLQACGLPMCKPEIAPLDERLFQIEACFNFNLALRLGGARPSLEVSEAIVLNDVSIGPQGRIIILTGPNQGGKTTYMQAIGLAQILAQSGSLVPGKRARLSPVDNIFTHYPLEEQLQLGLGRFGEESQRIREIFSQVTQGSLILLNESLFSTNPGESLYLAQDIVRILRLIGARAIFTTHLHELAASVDALNADTQGDSRIVSMVASPIEADDSDVPVDEGGYSYRIVFGPPLGRSYAARIARQHGISYQQLLDLLEDRGLIAK